MIIPSANFTIENNKPEKKPCFIVAFSESADPVFCSNTFGDIGSEHKKYITNITVESGEVDLNEPFIKLSRLTFTLLDKDSDVITLLNSNKIINQKVVCKFGYSALDEADFITFPDFYVIDYSIDANLLNFTFTCEEDSDIIRKLYYEDSYVFRNVTQSPLDADLTAIATDVIVIESDNFWVRTHSTTPIDMILQIGEELIDYSRANKNDATETFSSVTRGYGLSVGAKHSEGQLVKEVYKWVYADSDASQYEYQMTFAQIIINVLLTAGATGGSANNDIYNLIKSNFGLGLTTSQVNVEQIIAEGYHYHMTDFTATHSTYYELYRFLAGKQERAKTFLERVLKPLNAWLYFDEDGLLCCKVLNLPEMVLDYVTLTDHQKLDDDKCNISGMETLKKELINEYDFNLDYFIPTGVFQTVNNYDITESQTVYGIFPVSNILEYGSKSAGGQVVESHALHRKALFFDNVLMKLKIQTLSKYCLYQPFDMVKLDSSFIPNIAAGTRTSSNEPIMILKKTISQQGDKFSVAYDTLAFEMINKASSTYSSDTILSTFDDDAIVYDADFSDTLQAADGYHDNNWGDNVYYIYVKVRIVWGNGANQQNYITLGVMGCDIDNAEVVRNAVKITYMSDWNTTIDYWLPLLVLGDNIQRIKVDWFYRSTATGANLPTSITINEIRSVKVTY